MFADQRCFHQIRFSQLLEDFVQNFLWEIRDVFWSPPNSLGQRHCSLDSEFEIGKIFIEVKVKFNQIPSLPACSSSSALT